VRVCVCANICQPVLISGFAGCTQGLVSKKSNLCPVLTLCFRIVLASVCVCVEQFTSTFGIFDM
jgi:hypothetical protein